MKIILIILVIALSACCSDDSANKSKDLLYSSSAKERNQAALDLASCGNKAADAVPRLIDMLYDENIGVQSSAAFALRKIDTEKARKALDAATAARSSK